MHTPYSDAVQVLVPPPAQKQQESFCYHGDLSCNARNQHLGPPTTKGKILFLLQPLSELHMVGVICFKHCFPLTPAGNQSCPCRTVSGRLAIHVELFQAEIGQEGSQMELAVAAR